MSDDKKNGIILQRDKQSYAVVPHIPCGVVTPEVLRKFADVAENHNAAAIKLTSAARIAIVGVEKESVDTIFSDLDMPHGNAVGKCVRSIKVCPGTTFCALAKQDALTIGMELDNKYHGMELPAKSKFAVSGCNNQCSENCIKDLSLCGKKNGWTVMAGGIGTSKARLADIIAEDLDTETALNLFDRIITYYKENANKHERIGTMIERIGVDAVKEAVLAEAAIA